VCVWEVLVLIDRLSKQQLWQRPVSAAVKRRHDRSIQRTCSDFSAARAQFHFQFQLFSGSPYRPIHVRRHGLT